jgi:hypothetical protein
MIKTVDEALAALEKYWPSYKGHLPAGYADRATISHALFLVPDNRVGDHLWGEALAYTGFSLAVDGYDGPKDVETGLFCRPSHRPEGAVPWYFFQSNITVHETVLKAFVFKVEGIEEEQLHPPLVEGGPSLIFRAESLEERLARHMPDRLSGGHIM